MPYIEYAPELNRANPIALKNKFIHTTFDHSILGYHLASTKDNARKYPL